MSHPLLQEQGINTIVCHPEEENTMISAQPTGWMVYLLNNCTAAADIFSVSGQLRRTSHMHVPLQLIISHVYIIIH